ncbi:MAG: hypothetical protein CMF48_02355 [Legionellales bacterium]|nr:hypothetical protein [Legionellales bacterium]|tara:strand:+ start:434 stop:1243 length:810 start_codon:yes stop_codon:yes gene_type:complete
MTASLSHQAYEILIERSPDLVIEKTFQLHKAFQESLVPLEEHPTVRIESLGRPEKPILVSPRELKRRRLGTLEGRVALIHSLAHIEFNAIHLALDAVYRFHGLPIDYYEDWLSVAAEEAKHFSLLREHLRSLGYDYGDCPAHNGLWLMALETDDDVMIRMALVPRLLEARGLDVGPKIAEDLRKAGDEKAADIMCLIVEEEIGHVAIGNRWFHWCCEQRKLDPMSVFKEALEDRAKDILRGPLSHGLRREAGFNQAELDWLESSILKNN